MIVHNKLLRRTPSRSKRTQVGSAIPGISKAQTKPPPLNLAPVTPFLPTSIGQRKSRVRLFCFPHLGGGTAGYNSWPALLRDDIEMVPVHLPGREPRSHQRAIDCMTKLVDQLTHALEPWTEMPFAFFGHSMGAVIAFELAQRLESEGGPGPLCLFVSSCPSPDRVKNGDPCHNKTDDEMIKALVDAFGGSDAADPDEISLMRMMAPTIRADVKLLETYQHDRRMAGLNCPIVAVRGAADTHVSFADITAWKSFTRDRCSVRAYPGGHFFLRNQRPAIVAMINSQLERIHPNTGLF